MSFSNSVVLLAFVGDDECRTFDETEAVIHGYENISLAAKLLATRDEAIAPTKSVLRTNIEASTRDSYQHWSVTSPQRIPYSLGE